MPASEIEVAETCLARVPEYGAASEIAAAGTCLAGVPASEAQISMAAVQGGEEKLISRRLTGALASLEATRKSSCVRVASDQEFSAAVATQVFQNETGTAEGQTHSLFQESSVASSHTTSVFTTESRRTRRFNTLREWWTFQSARKMVIPTVTRGLCVFLKPVTN